MYAIYKREIIKFFSNGSAYFVLGVYLLLNALMLFVLDSGINVLESGYASVESFFVLSPYLFLFLIPAISMSMVSEDRKDGSLNLIFSHPVSGSQYYWGKFAAAFTLVIIALLPSTLYLYSINLLLDPGSSLDYYAALASYFGLLLASWGFVAIGLFASVLSANQLSSFVLALGISALFFVGFDEFSNIFGPGFASSFFREIGMTSHLEDLSRGVLGIYDLCYFIGLTIIFSALSLLKLNFNRYNKTQQKQGLIRATKIAAGVLAALVVISNFQFRIDFTKDKRYTLSPLSIDVAKSVESDIKITLLLSGDLPSGFKFLEKESQRIVEKLSKFNSKIHFNQGSIDAVKNDREYLQHLAELGVSAINLEVNRQGEKVSKHIYPYLIIKSGDRELAINLLQQTYGSSPEKQLNNSLENLEFEIVNGIDKASKKQKKNIAILRGHGELNERYLADLFYSLKDYYNLDKITLTQSSDLFDLEKSLSKVDLLLVVDPTEEFNQSQKLLLDQYIVGGGKSIWIMSGNTANMDSLYRHGRTIAIAKQNGLEDMLFKYGFRVNADIVMDYRCSLIKLASGSQGGNVQYHNFPWPFSPISVPESKHVIVKNSEVLKLNFSSSIDTIFSPGIEKTILLSSSDKTRTFGLPNFIKIDDPQRELDVNKFADGHKIYSLLLEGKFTSAFKNRILPYRPIKYLENAEKENKMIVVADASFAANQWQNNQILPIGYDKWFGISYGNKEFLINSVDYLLDDKQILSLKKKELELRVLDRAKIKENRTKIIAINILLPMLMLVIFAVVNRMWRRKRYIK